MVNKDNAALLLGIGAIVVTLGVGTCSTNARIDDMNQRMTDGFANVNQRFDDTNQRMTDGFANLQRQIDELQADVACGSTGRSTGGAGRAVPARPG